VPDTGTDELVYYREESGVAVEKVRVGYRLPYAGGTLTSALNEAPPVTIASAATVDIGAAASNTVIVSGTATITALGTIAAGAIRYIRATGAFTLTHNATSLIIPGGADFVATVGDVFRFESLGSGNWRMTGFASGTSASFQPLDATLTSLAAQGSTSFNTFVSTDQTITPAGALTLAHGLGATPRFWSVVLVCTTADLGYSVGDVVASYSINRPVLWPDATNLNVRFGANTITLLDKTTGVAANITNANWKARFSAIK
jgi:hypothetical protein